DGAAVAGRGDGDGGVDGAAVVGRGAGGGGGGSGFLALNSTPTASSSRISDTCPLSRRTRTALLSPPRNIPSMTFPERSLIRSADSDTLAAPTSIAAIDRAVGILIAFSFWSLDDRK